MTPVFYKAVIFVSCVPLPCTVLLWTNSIRPDLYNSTDPWEKETV